jgi:hypothetical protein
MTNTFGTKTFEDFMNSFFRDWSDGMYAKGLQKFRVFNRKLIIDMGTKTAEIVLKQNGHHGRFDGFQVSIIHKENGPLSSEWFGFAEYAMKGFKYKERHSFPHVLKSCGCDWYMDGPTQGAIQDMIDKMAQYLYIYV